MRSSNVVFCTLYILASVLGFAGCENMELNPEKVSVESVTLNSTSMEIEVGQSQTLTATISPSDADNRKVIWSTSNSSVATVADGVVTGVSAGSVTITAKSDDGGKTAICEVTVKAKTYPVESISLDKASHTMTEGDEFTLTATVKPDNATNKNISWTSNDTSVATVTDGKVTALKAGKTIITVTTEDGGKTATCEVTVDADIVSGTSLNLTCVTATTATFEGQHNISEQEIPYSIVKLYYSDSEDFSIGSAQCVQADGLVSSNDFSLLISDLKYNTRYRYCMVISIKSEDIFFDVAEFMTKDISVDLDAEADDISSAGAVLTGSVTGLSDVDKSDIQVGVTYSKNKSDLSIGNGVMVPIEEILNDGHFTLAIDGLTAFCTYFYCSFVCQDGIYVYGEVNSFMTSSPYSMQVSQVGATMCTLDYKISGQASYYCYKIFEKGDSLLDKLETKDIVDSGWGVGDEPIDTELLINLQPDTEYVLAYVGKGNGEYSNVLYESFRTQRLVTDVPESCEADIDMAFSDVTSEGFKLNLTYPANTHMCYRFAQVYPKYDDDLLPDYMTDVSDRGKWLSFLYSSTFVNLWPAEAVGYESCTMFYLTPDTTYVWAYCAEDINGVVGPVKFVSVKTLPEE